jgi:hypothetical protein
MPDKAERKALKKYKVIINNPLPNKVTTTPPFGMISPLRQQSPEGDGAHYDLTGRGTTAYRKWGGA